MIGYYVVQDGESLPFVAMLDPGRNSLFLARMTVARKRSESAVRMVYRLQFNCQCDDVGCAPITAAEYWQILRASRDTGGGTPAILPGGPAPKTPPPPVSREAKRGIAARMAV